MKMLPLLFSPYDHPLTASLLAALPADIGRISQRKFPDGESYLRIDEEVNGKHCIVLADLAHPNKKYLPLVFLFETLKELGASSVGLVAPYLAYMRQDRRFVDGEAVTSKIFATDLSQHVDWLVTIDPHLHRYHSLDEVYSIPNKVVQGAPALAQWLREQTNLFLVGPDSESEQWVADIAALSSHEFVIGQKHRKGDRDVEISLPDLSHLQQKTAVIIDDVISSGQTILECLSVLKAHGIKEISCAAVHGIFADESDKVLLGGGLKQLITCNTIKHDSNLIDVGPLLVTPINTCIEEVMEFRL